MHKLPGSAIVIGASIGGLSAARVLADHFERVTVIERDVLQEGPRQGAPQGHHIHVLLRKGVDLLEQYFPGLVEQMKADGIEPFDFTQDLRWLQFGDWMPRHRSGIVLYPQTRSSLERYLRGRLRAYPNVEILESTAVRALLATPDGRRILGVQTHDRQEDGGAVTNRIANVVVDASGRGSQLGKWLSELGFSPPEESRLPINLCYVSRLFEQPATARDWRGLWITPLPPEAPRGGAMQGVEGNRWIVSLFGYEGHHPPRDEAGFVEFARGLREPDLYEAIKDAKPVSDVQVYRVPDVRWRHFERVRDFPAGLLVLGDAWCYFDPVFGQGMSVAMLEANLLNEALHQLDSLDAVTQAWTASYLRTGAQWLQGLWFFVTAEALRHTHVPGERTKLVKLAQWYVEELYALNHAHPEIYQEFLKLMHVQAGPEFLLRPDIALRLAQRAWRKKSVKGFGHEALRSAPANAEAPTSEPRVALWPASRVAFGARYMGRVLANLVAPGAVGPRDRLCHFDTEVLWKPDQALGWFVRDALREQGLLGEAAEVRRFLEYWLPVQGLSAAKRALIEFSFNADEPGLGFMLYSDNGTVTQAFREYTRQLGITNEGVERSVAICETFRPSDLGLVRAEFKPGGPTRYSIAASWHFDPLRGHSGFNDAMSRLPERFRAGPFAERVKTHAAALSPEFFPLFLGLSFLDDGTLESKMYLVRFDEKQPPFQPGSALWRFLQDMGVSAAELERVRQVNALLWERSADKMTQIAIEASENQSQPKRVNFIYSGTQTSAVLEAISRFGYPESSKQSVRTFERMMQTDHAKFVAIRVGPEGLSPRLKLYKHGLFDFADLSVVEDGGLKPRDSAPAAVSSVPDVCLY
ncbi:NAD(P)/FAD-dependent oxidoreductase [Corallococcus macrosporus]|uniref:FAD-binding domain-containing protein n=1 Tax=Myxococcus fulvus (strain ATCC BAA-855 / HW-1) TaxID=483219 RepID=F8CN07_MYXFH|nr:FAD-dependent monooxygenase [Corallococcus macrosporus]AEI67813.1 FAD-binding domain-containing protein [Corallococcus macrosporus]